jgi:uncharacterized membrane-anchored protein YhcB (DUF1043 family)
MQDYNEFLSEMYGEGETPLHLNIKPKTKPIITKDPLVESLNRKYQLLENKNKKIENDFQQMKTFLKKLATQYSQLLDEINNLKKELDNKQDIRE